MPHPDAIPVVTRHSTLAPALQTRLTALLCEAVAAGVTPAVALAVLHEGRWQHEVAVGWYDPDTRRPLTLDALFDLASITKLFTTTALLGLVSAGRVRLHTPLSDIVPEFAARTPRPIDGGQDPHSKVTLPTPPALAGHTVEPARVTFWHLLTHTAGLPPWRAVFQAAGPAPQPPHPQQPDPLSPAQRWQAALAALMDYAFVGEPDGRTVRYSDIGLMLLGEAVARLHGTPGDLAAALVARVLEPLALDDVCFNPVSSGRAPRERCVPTEDDPAWRGRRVWGEVHDENAAGAGGIAGHAGLFATARAVARFGEAWRSRPQVFGIDPALAAAATAEQVAYEGSRRGLGFVLKAHVDSSAGEAMSAATYGHTGFTGTSLWIDPAAGRVVALLTSSVYPGRHTPGTHELRRAVHTLLATG